MVHLQSPISVFNPVDQSPSMVASPLHRTHHRSKASPCCDGSRSAAVDVAIVIAVMGASGYLLFPHLRFVSVKLIELTAMVLCVFKEEVSESPLIYGSIGLSVSCAGLAAWAALACTGTKCGSPNCKGLRRAVEFDIRLETEECVKNSNSNSSNRDGLKRGLLEHHRELEAELKKMAPPNGRAVLIFRGRCGCSVGRLEVPGTNKKHRKIKK